jgi:hypothetical protein
VEICSGGGNDVDACVNSQKSFCASLVPSGYDAKYGQQCIDAVKAAYADADLSADELRTVLQLKEPCDRLIKGPGEEGGGCDEDTDCNTLEELRCVVKIGQAEGTCQEPVEVGGGDPCDAAAQVCGGDYYCDGENCIRHKALGAACSYDAECADENRCNAAPDENGDLVGECVARLEDSSVCTDHNECQSNLCAKSPTATQGRCVSLVRLSPDSALCENLQ